MAIKPLREVLKHIEKSYTVDFELAGHKFERPPDVYQQADHEDQCPILILIILGGVIFLSKFQIGFSTFESHLI